MKLVVVLISVLVSQAFYLSYGRTSMKDKGRTKEVLENIHFEKEVKVVKELDFEGVEHERQVKTLEKHQNLRELVRMEMEEFATIKTKKIEMEDIQEELEVEDMAKSEKTKVEEEQILNDKDALLKEEEEWWWLICDTIHSFVIPSIALSGLLGWCFSCLITSKSMWPVIF